MRTIAAILLLGLLGCATKPATTADEPTKRTPSQAESTSPWNRCFSMSNDNFGVVCIVEVPSDSATAKRALLASLKRVPYGAADQIDNCLLTDITEMSGTEIRLKSGSKTVLHMRSDFPVTTAGGYIRGSAQLLGRKSQFALADHKEGRMEFVQNACSSGH
ncbi:hypothetical protein ACLVWU_11155 [Bdellovibrio sp. HCB290]|uniref:hypothetical protein n=1 Tax=Bdellovibrio sp. HCB290 TaxID=3394356 RepID=UPI0039B42CE3